MPIFLSSDIHTCPVESSVMGHPLQVACKEPVPEASAASLDQIASFKIYRLSNRDNHFDLQKPAHGIVRRAHIFDWIQQGFKHVYNQVSLTDFCFCDRSRKSIKNAVWCHDFTVISVTKSLACVASFSPSFLVIPPLLLPFKGIKYNIMFNIITPRLNQIEVKWSIILFDLFSPLAF